MFSQKLSLDEFHAHIEAVSAGRYRPYAGALASFAHLDGADGAPILVSCRWAFGDKPEPPRPGVAYPALVLGERWFPADTAVEALLSVLRAEGALGGRTLREPVGELEQLGAAGDSFTGWHETVFEASLGHGAYLYDRVPVVAQGQRPYPSVSHAVNEWVWRQRTDSRWLLPFHDLGKLRVLLPDTRARIQQVSWVGGTLRVQSERNAASDEVELQVVTVERRSSVALDSRAVDREIAWDVPPEAEAIEVYLVHRDGTLLSHRRLVRGEHHRALPGEFALLDLAKEELRRGEGERVEYKPFIAARNVKEQEVVRTVVAFANTHGGRIYIGVDDDGAPQGERKLAEVGKASPGESLADMLKHIEKLIREGIKPVPAATVSPLTVFGNPVVVVTVSAGEEAPYSTAQNDVYIRRGATTRKPDPQTELPAVAERARAREQRRVQQEREDALAHSSWDAD